MRKFALAAAVALASCGAAQGATREIVSEPWSALLRPAAGLTRADLAPTRAPAVLTPAAQLSELPEPAVFAMMLVGLCLIGYRASRVSDEKFE